MASIYCRLALVLLPAFAWADPIVITGVPAYSWTLGCVPTATAEILAYWDQHGYSGLLTASGDAIYQTANVLPEISELAADFRTTPDGATDFLYFWPGLEDYFGARGYSVETSGISTEIGAMFAVYRGEIDAGRPVLLGVLPFGDDAGHAVAGIGYELRADGPWYAFYDTWFESEPIRWAPFLPALPGIDWGVSSDIWIRPLAADPIATAPEPSSLVLASIALVLSGLCRLKLLSQ